LVQRFEDSDLAVEVDFGDCHTNAGGTDVDDRDRNWFAVLRPN
jgi:hypothetical protein